MKTYIVVCLICILTHSIAAQAVIDCTPTVMPNMEAKITYNSVILQQPSCCFNDLTGLTCIPDTCQIWLVAALNTATNTFDADQTSPGFLSLSPYPSAFVNNSSKNYFLTRVGVQSEVSCPSSPNNFFQVGNDGQCSTTNCNGLLPVGATTRFKYLLVDPATTTLLAKTQWSENIALYASQNPGTIGDSFGGRSAAMVVITAILCTAAGLLLLFLLIGCLVILCCKGKGKEEIRSIRESFRIPQYDTHNLKDISPYDNPSYEREKKYTTAATLPRTTATVEVVVPSAPDNVKIQNI